MEKSKSIKEFIIRYFTELSAAPAKTREVIEQYVADEALIEHIFFFDSVFPGYEIFAEEMVAEGNKVFVRARLKGMHKGNFNNIPPTFKVVEFPFAIGYEVENDKIVHHWLIADQAVLMEQLGLAMEVHA